MVEAAGGDDAGTGAVLEEDAETRQNDSVSSSPERVGLVSVFVITNLIDCTVFDEHLEVVLVVKKTHTVILVFPVCFSTFFIHSIAGLVVAAAAG
jgi:hypothetical protein